MVIAFLVALVVILISSLIKITPPPPLLLYSPCCKIMPLHLNKILNIFLADSCMLLEQIIPSLNSAFDMSRNEYDPLVFIPATVLQTLRNFSFLIAVGIYIYISYDTVCIQQTFCNVQLRRILKPSLLLPVLSVIKKKGFFISGLC